MSAPKYLDILRRRFAKAKSLPIGYGVAKGRPPGMTSAEWDEMEHPRGEGGKFSDKPGAGDDAPKKEKEAADEKAVESVQKPADPADRDKQSTAGSAMPQDNVQKPEEKKGEAAPPPQEQSIKDTVVTDSEVERVVNKLMSDPATPPKRGKAWEPDVLRDANGDGQTDAARVGVPGDMTPPPPPLMELPRLTPDERRVESEFNNMVNANPDVMRDKFLNMVLTAKDKKGDPVKTARMQKTFETDAAKALWPGWVVENQEERAKNRALYNIATHQAANAVTKMAFVKFLDEHALKGGNLNADGSKKFVLVTSGGCGSGKGYALSNVAQVSPLQDQAAAVWDSAGDQNATENEWLLNEARKRGMEVRYVYVHANPKNSWAHPKMGVLQRAMDPSNGRMVDAAVFTDSYVIGAKNFSSFMSRHSNDKDVRIAVLRNDQGEKPVLSDSIPAEALSIDRRDLYEFAVKTVIGRQGVPPAIKSAALSSWRIWGGVEGHAIRERAKATA